MLMSVTVALSVQLLLWLNLFNLIYKNFKIKLGYSIVVLTDLQYLNDMELPMVVKNYDNHPLDDISIAYIYSDFV